MPTPILTGLPLFASSGGFVTITKKLLSLGPVDMAIVAIYFIMVLGIGFYLKRFAGTGEDFFLAGRKMTAWVAGLSFISANLSSLETMGWSANAYEYGLFGAHAYFIGGAVAILFLAIVMIPFYYICKTHSVPGYLKLRYGEGSRSLAGVSFALMTVLVSGASMFAMAKILHLLLGWNMNVSIWVSSLTVAMYVTLGGLISAVFNEVLQFFLIWFGSLLIPILGLIDAGGWNNMMATIQKNVQVIHPDIKNADFGHLWRNLGSFTDNAMGVDWFGIVFGFGLAVSFGYWCTDFLQVQRVIVAKNLRAAQNGTIIGAVLKMCVPLIVTVPGLLGLAVLMDKNGPMVLVPESDAAANITANSYNDVLPLLMGQYLGPGLLGLGVTAMIAGFMSGMAGNVSAFATVWTYDVYRPILTRLKREASDRHYLNMGRWSSLIGVMISIGTAYILFYFNNILDYLQVLVYFFIVPLFGVVILGMLWKRATPAAGFWGFLTAMLFSMSMWCFVHTFPGGFEPKPSLTFEKGAVMRGETAKDGDAERLTRIIVESGTVKATNVPIPQAGDAWTASVVIGSDECVIPGEVQMGLNAGQKTDGAAAKEPKMLPVRVLAEEVILAGTDKDGTPEKVKVGTEGVPVVLKPGVHVNVARVVQRFNAAELNPKHVKVIARSEEAKPMAVNVYSAFWTLCLCLIVTVSVSLFTKPKPEAELKNLVFGLTPLPDEGPCPWYERPMLWAAVVAIALVAVNVIFW